MTPKGQVVFVVEDGKAIGRVVETGIEEGNRIQIITGVESGDEVIVAGNEKLKDGAIVSIAGEGIGGEGESQEEVKAPSEAKAGSGGGRQ